MNNLEHLGSIINGFFLVHPLSLVERLCLHAHTHSLVGSSTLSGLPAAPPLSFPQITLELSLCGVAGLTIQRSRPGRYRGGENPRVGLSFLVSIDIVTAKPCKRMGSELNNNQSTAVDSPHHLDMSDTLTDSGVYNHLKTMQLNFIAFITVKGCVTKNA